MEKLISMTDFVWEKYGIRKDINSYAELTIKYATFLKQKLELWMFIPCKIVDGVWVVLEEPKSKGDVQKFKNDSFDYNAYWDKQNKEYQEAKDRVLFEGFEVFKSVSALISFSKNGSGRLDWNKEGCFMMGYSQESTIEDLFNSHYVDLELTPTAQKQIS